MPELPKWYIRINGPNLEIVVSGQHASNGKVVPKTGGIDLRTPGSPPLLAIFEIRDGKLVICQHPDGKVRPKAMPKDADSAEDLIYLEFERDDDVEFDQL